MLRLCLLLVIFLTALGATGTNASTAAAATALDWTACGRFECATLAVPLDYENPAGRKIDLSLIRQPARDSAKRIGSLFVNPGGPGGSGIDFLQQWAPSLPGDIRDRFDVVSFDPRGVGKSAPLLCHDRLKQFVALDPTPDSDAELRQVRDETQAFATLCAQRGRDLLPHLGTQNVARDLDEMRKAVGDEKLTYLGYSYGTVIGAAYADLFPDRIRAMVLDGAVDMSLSADELSLGQAIGFERAMEHFIENCREQGCLKGRSEDPGAALDELLARVEQAPLPAPLADRPAGPGETFLALAVGLYSRRTWGTMSNAIQSGLDGDGTAIIRLADLYLGRKLDGTYDNSMETNSAVNCLDKAASRDPDHYEALAQEFAARAPRFGEAISGGWLICAYWQADPKPLPAPTAKGAPPIVVIGTTADPATPYAWSVAMSKQLESAVLVTNHGEGHTAYRSGVSCIDGLVNSYFLSVKVPASSTACGEPIPGSPPGIEAPLPGASAKQGESRLPLYAVMAGVVVLIGGLLLWLVPRRSEQDSE